MSDLRTAAQQALEYMKSVGQMDMYPEDWAIVERLEAALAEPVQEPVELFVVKHYGTDERPIIKGNGFDGLEVGTDREEADQFIAWINARITTSQCPAETEQEPVAWANMKDGEPVLLSISQHPEDRANWMNPVPLYTHSPQRKPLTEEEIAKCWHDTPWNADLKTRVFAFARAVERAHGIGVKE